MEKLTRCRIKITRPALATGDERSHLEKLTGCRIKATRPALATGNKRSHHGETHPL